MVGTLPSNAGGASSIPGWGTGVPHDSQSRNQNLRNRSNVLPSSIKTLKMNYIYIYKDLLKKRNNQGHERYKSLYDQKI